MLLFSPRPLRTLSERRRFGGHYPIFIVEKEDKSVHGPNEQSRIASQSTDALRRTAPVAENRLPLTLSSLCKTMQKTPGRNMDRCEDDAGSGTD